MWASLAPVDEVTHGQGRVIPSSKAQVIQSAEPTTIEEILVRSGQKVSKGQLLVRLDDAMLASELGQLQAETRSLTARAGRLEREGTRSEEHTSELQSLMRISYAVFCLKKKNNQITKYKSKQ